MKKSVKKALVTLLLLPFLGVGQCDFKKTVDKFDGSVTIMSKYTDVCFWKSIIKGDTAYLANLYIPCYTYTIGKGVYILLEDGSKLEFPKVEVTCDTNRDTPYKNSAYVKLSKEQVEILQTKRITDYRLNVVDKSLPVKNGNKIKESIKCLVKYNG